MAGLDLLQDTFAEEQLFARRHPVRRFFLRLFLALVLLVVAAGCYLWRYQPLVSGDTYGLSGDQVQEAQSVGGSSVVTYRAGETFEMIFSVRNTGRVPVRVTAVPDSELALVVDSYDVSVLPRNATAYEHSDALPFRSFALRPGEERLLALSYMFKDCGDPATAGNRTVRRQQVGYVLGGQIERVADVGLAQPLVIMRMPSC